MSALSRCVALERPFEIECADSGNDGWHGGYLQMGEEQVCDDMTGGTMVMDCELAADGNTTSVSCDAGLLCFARSLSHSVQRGVRDGILPGEESRRCPAAACVAAAAMAGLSTGPFLALCCSSVVRG